MKTLANLWRRFVLKMASLAHLFREMFYSACVTLIPKTNKIWVVGGSKGLRYADNSMYFFRYCNRHTDKRMVWLAASESVINEIRDEGYEAYSRDSLIGMWLGFRAKWHIFDVSPEDTGLSNRSAHLLNLWHGIPLKDISTKKQPPIPEKKDSLLLSFKKLFMENKKRELHYFLHPSFANRKQILDSFDVLERNLIIANLPRNEVFENAGNIVPKKSDLENFRMVTKLRSEGKTLIGYFPTWRGNDEDLFMGARDMRELEKLNAFLASNDCILLTKWHTCLYPAYGHDGAGADAEADIKALSRLSNFRVLDFDSDLNTFLPLCDLVTTDYSSLLFDYLWADRPQIFMAYDLVSYEEKWGFFFDYRNFVPGQIVHNIEDYCRVLHEYIKDKKRFSYAFSEARIKLRTRFYDTAEGSGAIVGMLNKI